MKINCHDYELLTHSWSGSRGAAYNQCVTFCKRHGFIKEEFTGYYVTDAGHKQIRLFEEKYPEILDKG